MTRKFETLSRSVPDVQRRVEPQVEAEDVEGRAAAAAPRRPRRRQPHHPRRRRLRQRRRPGEQIPIAVGSAAQVVVVVAGAAVARAGLARARVVVAAAARAVALAGARLARARVAREPSAPLAAAAARAPSVQRRRRRGAPVAGDFDLDEVEVGVVVFGQHLLRPRDRVDLVVERAQRVLQRWWCAAVGEGVGARVVVGRLDNDGEQEAKQEEDGDEGVRRVHPEIGCVGVVLRPRGERLEASKLWRGVNAQL